MRRLKDCLVFVMKFLTVRLSYKLCDLLERGDKVLTEKGFNIQDIFAEEGVLLFMPSKRQKRQVRLGKKYVFNT